MKNILVPISFSETSKNALQHVHLIANQNKASISLFHCYPIREFNREYDFGDLEYSKGIQQMLKQFYNENIDIPGVMPANYLSYPGSVSDIITKISHRYDLLFLSIITQFQSSHNKWFSEKIFYFTSKSLCPVLLLPTIRDDFSFSNIKNIWHIKRKDNETELIQKALQKLKINTTTIQSKSLQQKSFTSAFWRNIVSYSENKNKTDLKEISNSFGDEKIDLLVLVNHRKGLFENFLKDTVFQIISQFDIPIIVFQEN